MATNTTLTEENRTKLDGIVQKMVDNKESDENIQWVVNDFKQKYGSQEKPWKTIGDEEKLPWYVPGDPKETLADPTKNTLGALATGASGINQGLANTVGLPVDAATGAINAVSGVFGGPQIKNPVMGSQWIKENIMPTPVKPNGLVQNITGALGEQIGGMAIPGMKAASTAAKTGQSLSPILGQLLKGATGAGVGSGIARTALPGSDTADIAGQVIGGLGYGIPGAINKAPMSMYEYGKQIKEIITHGIEKGVKPPNSSMGSNLASREKYYNRATTAVLDAVDNKTNLNFIDKEGEEVMGRLPKTNHELLQVAEQRKKEIFQQYDAMKQAAGEQGAMVDNAPIISKLKTLIKTKTISPQQLKLNDDVAERIKLLENHGPLTASEAQQEIANLNSLLNNKKMTPLYSDIGKLHVDAIIATELRNGLDAAITKEVGPGYKALKAKYGAWTTIEDDVAHRVNQLAGKAPRTIFDLSDVWTGYHVMYGALTGNLPAMGSGVWAAITKKRLNLLNSPNKAIETMFNKVENVNSKPRVGMFNEPESNWDLPKGSPPPNNSEFKTQEDVDKFLKQGEFNRMKNWGR